MTQIRLERSRPDARRVDLLEALWPLLVAVVRAAARGKAAAGVLDELLPLTREALAGSAEGDVLTFHVPSPGGMCAGSRLALEHWLYLATLVLRPQLDPVLAQHGFRFEGAVPTLEGALGRSVHTPMIVLRGIVHGIDPDGSVFADDGRGVAALTPAQHRSVAAILASGRCACPMCEGLRKSVPAIDVAALRAKLASAERATSLRAALASAEVVRALDLSGRRDVDGPLQDGLGRLVGLETLNLDDTRLGSLPDAIGELRRLRRLFLSRSTLPALPESIGRTALECLRAEHTSLSSLPQALGGLPLRSVSLGPSQIRDPAGFLPVLARLSSLEELELRAPVVPRSIPLDAAQAAFAARWVRDLEAFDFARLALKRLELWSFALTCVPPSVAGCHRLEELTIAFADVRTLALDLSALPLTRLRIDGGVDAVPPWVGSLPRLRSLSLEGTFDTVPDALFALQGLRHLQLRGRLRTLPAGVARLAALEELRLSDNPLTELPPEIAALPALKELDLRDVPGGARLAASLPWRAGVRVLAREPAARAPG